MPLLSQADAVGGVESLQGAEMTDEQFAEIQRMLKLEHALYDCALVIRRAADAANRQRKARVLEFNTPKPLPMVKD